MIDTEAAAERDNWLEMSQEQRAIVAACLDAHRTMQQRNIAKSVGVSDAHVCIWGESI